MTARLQRLFAEKLEEKAAQEGLIQRAAKEREVIESGLPALVEALKETMRNHSATSDEVLKISEGYTYQNKWHESFSVINQIDNREFHLNFFRTGGPIWVSCRKTKTTGYEPSYLWEMTFEGCIENGEVTLKLKDKGKCSGTSLSAEEVAEVLLERILR